MASSIERAEEDADAVQCQMHPQREAMCKYLRLKLPHMSDSDVHDLEVGVFNASIAAGNDRFISCFWRNPIFVALYEHKARSIAANLDRTSYVGNERLATRLSDREFHPHEVASMQRDHLFPERWRDVVQAKIQRDEYISTAKPVAMTDQFRCARCKKRECSFMEMQTRSCDEPATLFIQCLVCGNRWRLG